MTGNKAVYNLKTAEADMEGNVSIQQPDMQLNADKVHSTNKNYVVATGSVRGVYDDKKVNGDKVEYYLDQDYGIVTGNGYLEAQGSQMWADHIDAWFKQIKAVGTGNVHIESPAENLVAYANQAVYTQTPGQNDGVIHLTGNVNATQNGNSSTATTSISAWPIIPSRPGAGRPSSSYRAVIRKSKGYLCLFRLKIS